MATRQKLAATAKREARRCFHGAVMKTKPNIEPMINLFPWTMEKADGNWCAAFVYYCCIKAGFKIPIKPQGCVSSNLAGCFAWEEWALYNPDLLYISGDNTTFAPEPGDIVLFDHVFINVEHDHIGIVVENRENSIITAEGNINNVSGVMERGKDDHIRAYIRLPDDYEYHV